VKFLLDTNIFIPLEPTSFDDIEEGTGLASELLRLFASSAHQHYIHPAISKDIGRDTDLKRKALRQILLKKYPELPEPPPIPSQMESSLGQVLPDTNDWVDHQLLAAVTQDAVDFLVTEDVGIHRKAKKLGISDRVATIPTAISIIHGLFDTVPPELPAVQATKAHLLNKEDPIFESLRADYGSEFDGWLVKCKREHRDTWIVMGNQSDYAAIMIVNQEQDPKYRNHGMSGKILKLCTFKVSEKYNEQKYGELLLKTIFEYSRRNQYEWLFLEVFPKQEHLIGYLEDFGFEKTGGKSDKGEFVLSKPMVVDESDRTTMEALPFHVRYGPYEAKISNNLCFAIPIKPAYHRLLFPELEKGQIDLFAGRTPFGNSIRKAYLCHAQSRQICPGAYLLFYRSHDKQAVMVTGVAEKTLVSDNPDTISRFVGKRTVYGFEEITEFCGKREVLVILFRKSRELEPPIGVDELTENRVLARAPQSIVSIQEGALPWLEQRIRK